MKRPSESKLRQRRELNAQNYRRDTSQPRGAPPKPREVHANIGTDDDVRAYCRRMGYVYETTTKTKESVR